MSVPLRPANVLPSPFDSTFRSLASPYVLEISHRYVILISSPWLSASFTPLLHCRFIHATYHNAIDCKVGGPGVKRRLDAGRRISHLEAATFRDHHHHCRRPSLPPLLFRDIFPLDWLLSNPQTLCACVSISSMAWRLSPAPLTSEVSTPPPLPSPTSILSTDKIGLILYW